MLPPLVPAPRPRPAPRLPVPGRHRAGLAALVFAGLLTACGAGDEAAQVDPAELEALRQEVATLTERDIVREERLEELESATERLARSDPSARVTDAERELARVVDTLTALDEELATAVTDNAQRDAEVATTMAELTEQNAALLDANEQLRTTVGELRGQLDGARGRIDRVSGEVEDLEIRYATLRDRLDRLGR
jgi:chromosome segregation ATPase